MSWHFNNDIQAVEYGIVGSNRQLPSDADSVSVISDGSNSSDIEVITDTNTLAVDTNICQRRSQTRAAARASGYFALPSAAFPAIKMAYKL